MRLSIKNAMIDLVFQVSSVLSNPSLRKIIVQKQPQGRDPSDRDRHAPATAPGNPGPLSTESSLPQHLSGRPTARVIRSADLLQGAGEVHILHNGEIYRLTVTRACKLILHK
jgi:hemin uptake protein HemP